MRKIFDSIPTYAVLIILVLISVLVTTLPFIVRSAGGNDALIGSDSYLNVGLAQNIAHPGSYPLPQEGINGFHYVTSSLLSQPGFFAKAFPVLLGVLTVIVLFFILRKLGFSMSMNVLACLLLIVSPLFIVLHTSFNPMSLFLFIIAGSWLAFLYKPKLGMALLLLSLAIDARGFVLACLAMISYAVLVKKSRDVLLGFVVGAAIGVLLTFIDALVFSPIGGGFGVDDVLVSLGSGFGFSSFILILTFIGVTVSASKKNRVIASIIIMFGVFIYSLFDPLARIIILLVSAMFAAKGLLYLMAREWSVSTIKLVSVFLVILGVLFTAIMTISAQVDADPSLSKVQALNFLKTSPEQDVVLSSAQNGVFIERIAKRQAFLDNADDSDQAVADEIFYALRMPEVSSLLSENGISHILIDSDMRNGQIWNHEDQGLLFLLENNARFVQVYSKGGIDIYRFVG